MKRDVYARLVAWKNKKNRKPLVIRGARQVGKTWLVREFGKNEFSSFAYVNCDSNETVRELFDHDFDMQRIIRGLSAVTNTVIVPGETLIFLDEVQEVPRAIQSLKYFCEDAPEYHVIAAGSLLGIHEHQGISFPVGKNETLYMYPLNFFEFLNAAAGEQMLQYVSSSSWTELSNVHEKLVEYLRQYYFTGGMPEAVQAFIDGKSPIEVRDIQKQILSDYQEDISKHAPKEQVPRIDQVWNSIPSQLAKENKKFIYGHIRKGARAKDFELAIEWLCNAGIVYKITRLTKAELPLKFYEDGEAFKLFLLDCGLMGALAEAPASEILIGNHAFIEYKGAFTEQYVLQQLKSAVADSIYYFSADDSKQELDFVFQGAATVVPVEVKAEENLRAKSLRQYCLEHPDIKGVRISMSRYREEDWLINIPLYAALRISEIDNKKALSGIGVRT